MKDKVKLGLVLTICLIACLVLDYFFNYFFDLIILLLCFVGVKEFKKLQLMSGMPTIWYVPEISCLLIFASTILGLILSLNAVVILIIAIAVCILCYISSFLIYITFFKKSLLEDKFRAISEMSPNAFAFFKANNTLTNILYPTMLVFFVYFINHISEIHLTNFTSNITSGKIGLFGLILLFAICCLTDTFAMLFGKLVGKKKIFPKISPKKTLGGALFGLLGGMLGSILTYIIFSLIFVSAYSGVSLWQFVIVGFIGSVVAQSGDLFESLLKRKAGVKDSGDFFRSHGGVLDRVDSIIFGAPFVFVCLLFLFG